jgi:hypothetical protein
LRAANPLIFFVVSGGLPMNTADAAGHGCHWTHHRSFPRGLHALFLKAGRSRCRVRRLSTIFFETGFQCWVKRKVGIEAIRDAEISPYRGKNRNYTTERI